MSKEIFSEEPHITYFGIETFISFLNRADTIRLEENGSGNIATLSDKPENDILFSVEMDGSILKKFDVYKEDVISISFNEKTEMFTILLDEKTTLLFSLYTLNKINPIKAGM